MKIDKEGISTADAIKIIFSDVDATLRIPPCDHIDPKIFDHLRTLHHHGVRICIASGRTHRSLYALFAPILDVVDLISFDGALVMRGDTVLLESPIPKTTLDRTLAMMPKSEIYFLGRTKIFRYGGTASAPEFPEAIPIQRLTQIDESIYRISFRNEHSPTLDRYLAYMRNNRRLHLVYHDATWHDLVCDGVDKGSTATALLRQSGISREAAAAFGDNTNDYTLLKAVRESYAMRNGKPEIKGVARHLCDDVAQELERMIAHV